MADPVAVPAMDEPTDVEMAVDGARDDVDESKQIEPEVPETSIFEDEAIPKRIVFADYLKSQIVEIGVGHEPDTATVLSCHQDILTKSPFFERACSDFTDDTTPRRINLPDDDPEAVGSFLEYLYMGEYFPRRIGEGRDGPLETHPSLPSIDSNGDQLLRHARVYSLADKFDIPELKSLAHSKIHRTTSTAQGEIAYARYVYGNTAADDTTIRKPIAAFWAMRSHVLRHEAEEEFRAMCLEFPQFGFDVLSMVLDQKEKRNQPSTATGASLANVTVDMGSPGPKSRKRTRASVDV